jgi:hypothetical protein
MSGSKAPERVSALTGTVSRGAFAEGSKSAREGIWLQAGERRLLLRRKDGPSFGDTQLQHYIGKTVRCDGFVLDYLLIAERITVLG